MSTKNFFRLAVCVAVLFVAQASLFAAPILGLYNSGVDNTGTPLPNSATSHDTHYALVVNPDISSPFMGDGFTHVEDKTAFPVGGAWIANSATAGWIAPEFNTGGSAGGNYDYQLTFNIPFSPSSGSITGQWATDNGGTDILINGHSTGNTSASFGSLTSFTISSGLVKGLNTLDFLVNNAGNGYTGLFVTNLTGTAAPEPASFVLGGLGAIGLFIVARRRRKA